MKLAQYERELFGRSGDAESVERLSRRYSQLAYGAVSGARVPVMDGATRIYGIIGNPIAQVRSPAVFTERFSRAREERGDDSAKCGARVGTATVGGINLLINASSTGMAAGDGLPASLEPFGRELFVADVVPRTDPTPLLALAKERGCRTMAGQTMVTGQAEAILRFYGLV